MLNEKKGVPKLRQEVKVDIVTSDDIKIYYTWKFQDFTARYIIKRYFREEKYLHIGQCRSKTQGYYSPAIPKNILCLLFQDLQSGMLHNF